MNNKNVSISLMVSPEEFVLLRLLIAAERKRAYRKLYRATLEERGLVRDQYEVTQRLEERFSQTELSLQI